MSTYPPFAVTVDLALFTIRAGELCVLLVERGNPPFQGAWALPGGFVGIDEAVGDAARRELAEETGIDVFPGHVEQLATYGDPDRDPRMRVVSVAHVAFAPNLPVPQAGSDAARARWWPVTDLGLEDPATTAGHQRARAEGDGGQEDAQGGPGAEDGPADARAVGAGQEGTQGDGPRPDGREGAAGGGPEPVEVGAAAAPETLELAFDHARILTDALERVRSKLEYTTLAAQFAEEPFTLNDLYRVYGAVWGVAPDLGDFRRKVLSTAGFVVRVDDPGSAPGPRTLYRRGPARMLHPPLLRPSAEPETQM